jgi:predicted permease
MIMCNQARSQPVIIGNPTCVVLEAVEIEGYAEVESLIDEASWITTSSGEVAVGLRLNTYYLQAFSMSLQQKFPHLGPIELIVVVEKIVSSTGSNFVVAMDYIDLDEPANSTRQIFDTYVTFQTADDVAQILA